MYIVLTAKTRTSRLTHHLSPWHLRISVKPPMLPGLLDGPCSFVDHCVALNFHWEPGDTVRGIRLSHISRQRTGELRKPLPSSHKYPTVSLCTLLLPGLGVFTTVICVTRRRSMLPNYPFSLPQDLCISGSLHARRSAY